MAPGIPEAAICVQVIAAQYILQFAIVIALCCALHRSASRVIHRSECFHIFQVDILALEISSMNKLYNGATTAGVSSILSARRIPVRELRIYKRYAQVLLSILPSKREANGHPREPEPGTWTTHHSCLLVSVPSQSSRAMPPVAAQGQTTRTFKRSSVN